MVGWFLAIPFFAVFDVPIVNGTWVPPLWFGILAVPLGILVFFVSLHALNGWSWVCARWAEVLFRGPGPAAGGLAAPPAAPLPPTAPTPPHAVATPMTPPAPPQAAPAPITPPAPVAPQPEVATVPQPPNDPSSSQPLQPGDASSPDETGRQ